MTRNSVRRQGKKLDPRKLQLGRVATELHLPGQRRKNALFNLKMETDVAEMLRLLTHAMKNRDVLQTLHGAPFPASVASLFGIPAYVRPAKGHTELLWGLFRVSLFARELSEFSDLREQFEIAVLLDERSMVNELLDTIEKRFGVSIWLIQNRLALAQVWHGLEEKRRLASEYVEKAKGNSLTQLLIRFISKRSEATGLKNYLQDELNRFLGDTSNPLLEAYIRTKLFELGQPSTPNFAATLFFEAQSSLIDHYETLILVLQSVAVDTSLPDIIARDIAKFLQNHPDLSDPRLNSIVRTLDDSNAPSHREISIPHSRIIEAYSAGDYDSVIQQSYDYLLDNPRDIAIYALTAKSLLAAQLPPPAYPGLLGELLRLFKLLFEFGEDTYGAAFAIYTMHERFYGHSWAVMARALMNDALAQEAEEYPSLDFKYALSIDPYISPFTALTVPSQAKEKFLSSSVFLAHYPNTINVLKALIHGEIQNPGDEIRLSKYVARHDLISGNYRKAAQEYSELMHKGRLVDRFRASACATLAHLALDDLPSAVDAVVFGALLNKEVQIILPVPDVVQRLEAVEKWPSSISLPILFELYSTHFGDDKETYLRFAFERFQLANQISEPDEISKRIDEFGRERVIAYLDSVWRPDVMRQTLLYETPKETEDARIAVCRVLAALDPDNSAKYQEEIRDRVKRQEIAKGTTLVEQSKVYVDISAIKKALNARLGDTYTRYKNATRTNPNQQEQIMEELADLVSNNLSDQNSSLTNVLSSLHLLDYKESELDLQFSALFSEVTNEFLKGDHGLNAYLSTRVRHGTLANTLRKPLADEHLVTALKEDESGYVANESWDDELNLLPQDERQHINDALNRFSASFDKIVDYVKNILIQIKVLHDFAGVTENTDSLFVYRSSNLERKFIQEYDKKISNIEQLIDRCIESLWEKTDANLTVVRATLRDKVRTDFLNCFDILTDEIASSSNPQAVSEILNAVARAKTNFQTKFHVVQSWFNRSEVYDRQDYNPEYAVQIALNMVQKTIPNGFHELQVDIDNQTPSATMPGRTLDAMVDVFAGLFDNATIRSGLSTDALKVKVCLILENGKFFAQVSNNIAGDRPSVSDREKINKIRDSLNRSESRARAQREGGSGLLKIWRAISSPIYKDPEFTFDYEEGRSFNIQIKFKIDQAENENTTH